MARIIQGKVLAALRIGFIPVGLGILVGWAIDQGAAKSFEKADHYLLFGLIVSQVSVAVFALRFRQIVRIGKVELTFVRAYKLHLQSLFYFFFVPLSVGSEVSKVAKLSHMFPEIGKARLTIMVLLDRFVGLTSFFLLCAATFPFVAPRFNWSVTDGILVVVSCILVVLTVVLSSWRLSGRYRWFRTSMHLVRRNYIKILYAGFLSLCMQLLMVFAGYLASIGWDLKLSPVDFTFAMSSAFLFQIIPLNVGGAGGVEVAGVALYILIGAGAQGALLMASTLYLYRLVGAILGGACELACKSKASDKR